MLKLTANIGLTCLRSPAAIRQCRAWLKTESTRGQVGAIRPEVELCTIDGRGPSNKFTLSPEGSLVASSPRRQVDGAELVFILGPLTKKAAL